MWRVLKIQITVSHKWVSTDPKQALTPFVEEKQICIEIETEVATYSQASRHNPEMRGLVV